MDIWIADTAAKCLNWLVVVDGINTTIKVVDANDELVARFRSFDRGLWTINDTHICNEWRIAAVLQLCLALKGHDWYYGFSDDGRVYRRGQEEVQEIKSLYKQARITPETFRKFFRMYAPQKFEPDYMLLE